MTCNLSTAFLLLVSTLTIVHVHSWSPWHFTHMSRDRSVIVQMFEWRFDDIANECRNFLGPNGYGAVQVSPVSESILIDNGPGKIQHPWYQRYQVVSYKFASRSGSFDDFKDMVQTCREAGVRVYVDMVINHMTADSDGVGSGGTAYNGTAMDYPGVPFNASHFNKNKCNSSDGGIHDFEDEFESRNCELVGLHDLNQDIEYVRDKQVEFFNSLIKVGVAGFRIDASKHMYPHTIKKTFDALEPLDPYFGPNSKPFMYHESSALGGVETGIKAAEYIGVGRVLNFKYMHNMRDIITKNKGRQLKELKNVGQKMGMLASEDNVPIVDNHDLQRTFAHPKIRQGLSFFDPKNMKIGNAFMLASGYGHTPKVMSSYNWTVKMRPSNLEDENQWRGPPDTGKNDENRAFQIKRVSVKDGQCEGEWVCEHRWPEIVAMVKFRNVAKGAPATNWWDNGGDAIAFAREKKGFIAINNQDKSVEQTLNTTLPGGSYCDVISGGRAEGNTCKNEGKKIDVESNGNAKIKVDPSETPIVAYHVGQDSKLDPVVATTTPPTPSTAGPSAAPSKLFFF